jgi:hypothetical protein
MFSKEVQFFLISLGGVGMSPLGQPASNLPTVPALDYK